MLNWWSVNIFYRCAGKTSGIVYIYIYIYIQQLMEFQINLMKTQISL